MNLQDFVAAQDDIWDEVRAELSQGDKRTHWMWFVFPQIAGLGSSPLARHYAVPGLPEAQRYVAHPLLGSRLAECTQLMLGWSGRRSAETILGKIDAMKFCSSMTLFELASDTPDLFSHAIDAFCDGKRDERTLHLLNLETADPR